MTAKKTPIQTQLSRPFEDSVNNLIADYKHDQAKTVVHRLMEIRQEALRSIEELDRQKTEKTAIIAHTENN